MDTPDARRAQLAQQREESQKRMEARRDQVIAEKKAAVATIREASNNSSLSIKNTTQNLVTAMKNWVKLPKAGASAEEVAVCEKEIASLTVKLSEVAPSKEIKARFVGNIKQLLMRGKLAIADPTDELISELTLALKAVAEDLKEFVTSSTPGGSPATPARKLPGHLASHTRTASSPALTFGTTRGAAGPAAADGDAAATGDPATTPVRGLSTTDSLPDRTGRGPTSLASTANSTTAVARSLMTLRRDPSVSLSTSTDGNRPSNPTLQGSGGPVPITANEYDDGSPVPNPSQDIHSAMYEQSEQLPKLSVPWVVDYLCAQTLNRGGGFKVRICSKQR
jgi:hypothetical protein